MKKMQNIQKLSTAQNGEDVFLWKYCQNNNITSGHFLDIGANDGVTLSNSRLFYVLASDRWSFDLVEPDPVAFNRLSQLYRGCPNATLHNVALTEKTGRYVLHSSGSHEPSIYGENTGLLSSVLDSQRKRFPSENFEPVMVDGIEPGEFFHHLDHLPDIISIDAEGMDLHILLGLPDDFLRNASAIVVEWNATTDLMKSIDEVLRPAGFSLYVKNHENLIFIK